MILLVNNKSKTCQEVLVAVLILNLMYQPKIKNKKNPQSHGNSHKCGRGNWNNNPNWNKNGKLNVSSVGDLGHTMWQCNYCFIVLAKKNYCFIVCFIVISIHQDLIRYNNQYPDSGATNHITVDTNNFNMTRLVWT